MTTTINPDKIMKSQTMKTESTPTPKKRSKPHPHPRTPDRQERYFELAFTGLLAGIRFEIPRPDGKGVFTLDSKQQLKRLRSVPFLAWNAARFACELFEFDGDEEKEIEAFNENLKAAKEAAKAEEEAQ
jgi:hypothetical protein